MYQLENSLLEDLLPVVEVVHHFWNDYKAGTEKISPCALRAMNRRYLTLCEAESLTWSEVFEFARLDVFFALEGCSGVPCTVADSVVQVWNTLAAMDVCYV
jgi:hypothetical protein